MIFWCSGFQKFFNGQILIGDKCNRGDMNINKSDLKLIIKELSGYKYHLSSEEINWYRSMHWTIFRVFNCPKGYVIWYYSPDIKRYVSVYTEFYRR